MEHLYNLPTLLRIFLFASLSAILAALIVIITIMIINRNRSKLFVSYIISVTITILVITITRTPLMSSINNLIFNISNSIVLVPICMSILLMIKTKKEIYLFDTIIFIVNLPAFFVFEFWKFVYIVSIGYLFIRSFILVISEYENSLHNPGTYMIKEALDRLTPGVIFANKNGQITYINESMKHYLDELNIPQHNRINKILNQLSFIENKDRKIANKILKEICIYARFITITNCINSEEIAKNIFDLNGIIINIEKDIEKICKKCDIIIDMKNAKIVGDGILDVPKIGGNTNEKNSYFNWWRRLPRTKCSY